MTRKERYKELCAKHAIPLMQQHWWMEAVCAGKEWDVALVFGQPGGKKFSLEEQEGDTLVGAMPYLLRHRMGFRYVLQPQLTQYNGPWYNYALLKAGHTESQRLDFEKKVADKLMLHMQRLRLHYFQQQFAPSVTNWLPYHWWGCHQTTRYTYRIEDLSNLERVFAAFDPHQRQRHIRKLEGAYDTYLGMTPEAFADMHARYMAHRGRKDLVSKEFIVRLCTAALEHGSGVILALRPKGEECVAAAWFVVWDDESASALLMASEPGRFVSGLNELLVWKVLQYVAPLTRVFDFEGSMDMNIERYYRLYGAHQTPYHRITRCNSRLFQFILERKAARDRRELTRQAREYHRQHYQPKKHHSKNKPKK